MAFPPDGTTGQILAKASNASYDTEWVNNDVGSVTSVSVVNANGFNGSVATATTTPAITIQTTVNGLVKGNGTSISAAVANTDYTTPAYVNAKVEDQIINGVTTIAPSQNAVFDADKNLQDQIDDIIADSVVSVTGDSPIIVDNTDPNNPIVQIQQSNTTDDGYLSATDWNTFNNKQAALNPAALTKSDDTNVTVTLGGTPATALLQAVSLTLGWAGQLSITRGGTGQATAILGFNALSPLITLGDLLYHNGTNNVRLAGQITVAKQFLSQTGNGAISAAPIWAAVTAGDIGSGEALTKSDDTNVTITLGGTPATSLLKATSLTLGWTGQLSISRGGTGESTALAAFNALSPLTTLGDLLYFNGTNNIRLAGQITTAKQFLSQTGTGIISASPIWATVTAGDIGSGESLTKTDDTNVTLTLGGTPTTALLKATSLTLGWSGQLAISRGGTGQNTAILGFNALSPLTTLGDVIYHNGTNNVRLAGQITTTKQFLSQTGTGVISAAPVWEAVTAGDVGGGEALTKIDDTNVTLTLGGTPATALLKASSLTLGWTGTLAPSRGGTGVSNTGTITLGGNLVTSGAFSLTLTLTNTTNVTLPTTGTLATLAGVEILTNKTIDADLNTITNIENADIKAAAAIAVNKLAALTASRIVITDGSGFILAADTTTYPNLTELSYVKGVTSAIQTQLDSKASSSLTDSHIFVGNGSNIATDVAMSGDVTINNTGVTDISAGVIIDNDINASAAINAIKIANGSVSNSEFECLNGVTSAIQTQINTKVTKGGDSIAATLTIGTGDNNVLSLITNNNPTIYAQTNKRIALNHSSPQSTLHIYGDGSNGANGFIFFGDSFSGGTTSYVCIGENGGTDSDAMEIYAKNGIYMRVSTYGGTAALFINSSSSIGLANESPTAKLHLQPCTSGANNSSLKIPSGTLSTASDGAVDYDGTNYYACVGTTRYQIARVLTGSASLNFPNTLAQTSSDLTITVTGAADGDSVSLGVPNAAVNANSCYTAWVSAANTVTVRFNNYSALAINPASGTFRATVIKN